MFLHAQLQSLKQGLHLAFVYFGWTAIIVNEIAWLLAVMFSVWYILLLNSVYFIFFHFYSILLIVDFTLINFLITLFEICVLLLYDFDFLRYIIHLCSHRFYKWTKFTPTITQNLILSYTFYILIWRIAMQHWVIVLEIIIELFFFRWSCFHLKAECFFFNSIPLIFFVAKTSYCKFRSSYSDFGSCWRLQKMPLIGFTNQFLFTIILCF